MPVIGLSGPAGSGKTTAAQAILKTPGYVRLPLAGPIKHMLRAGLGLTDRQTDGDLKEVPIPRLGGLTPRRLLQTLGTEWGRSLDDQFWIKLWLQQARDEVWNGARGIVVDDVRFLNEANFLRKETGARLVSLVTPHVGPLGDAEAAHSSELELTSILSQADAIITNRKVNVKDFQLEVLKAVELA